MLYVFILTVGNFTAPQQSAALPGSGENELPAKKTLGPESAEPRTTTQTNLAPSNTLPVKNHSTHNSQARAGFPDMTVVGNLYVEPGTIVSDEGSLIIADTGRLENWGTIYVKGDWVNEGNYITDTGKVVFWGSDASLITGTSITDIYNAEINNTGGVTMELDLEVSNNLNLVAGSLDLNANRLTISNDAGTGISYTNGYIISENVNNLSMVQWNIGTTTGPHTIPFGTITGTIIPLTINLTSGSIGNVTASTYPTSSNNLPLPVRPDSVIHLRNTLGSNNSANTVDRFWQIDKTGLSGTITATFTYAEAEVPEYGEIDLRAQRYKVINLGWDPKFPNQVSNSNANTVESPGISNFGPFTLAVNPNPLPVELFSFKAQLNKLNQVDVKWATASEVNNDYFTVERTRNFNSIEPLAKIPGNGTTSMLHHYSFIDKNPMKGLSYYRIKQTDFDGGFAYTDWRAINTNDNHESNKLLVHNLYPNPFSDNFNLVFELPDEGMVEIQLLNAQGKIIYSEKTTGAKGINSYQYNSQVELSTGYYYLRLSFDDLVTTVRLVNRD